jgi:membrane protein YdbS with pleckstrin-like domain
MLDVDALIRSWLPPLLLIGVVVVVAKWVAANWPWIVAGAAVLVLAFALVLSGPSLRQWWARRVQRDIRVGPQTGDQPDCANPIHR